jgi:hypothetical protein
MPMTTTTRNAESSINTTDGIRRRTTKPTTTTNSTNECVGEALQIIATNSSTIGRRRGLPTTTRRRLYANKTMMAMMIWMMLVMMARMVVTMTRLRVRVMVATDEETIAIRLASHNQPKVSDTHTYLQRGEACLCATTNASGRYYTMQWPNGQSKSNTTQQMAVLPYCSLGATM